MPINIYCGLQGSGKTYEVVSEVIVPALAKGRRVVTNVEGLQADKIRDFIRVKDPDLPVGEIVTVSNHDVGKPGFWATDDTDTAFVKGGDLVCIDEAWRFFGVGSKLTAETMVFFREHRHFTDKETGQTCDIVLMLQSATDLHRQVKSVIETSFRTHKLKSVGMPTRYRLDMFEGSDQRITRRVNTWQKRYNPEVFVLYASYAGGTGQETAIDKRQNLLRDPKLWGTLLLALAFIAGAGVGLRHLYLKYGPKPDVPSVVPPAMATKQEPGTDTPPAQQKPDDPPLSTTLRLSGSITLPGLVVDLVDGPYAAPRPVFPDDCTGHGLMRACIIDGERVTPYSGPGRQTGLFAGKDINR